MRSHVLPLQICILLCILYQGAVQGQNCIDYGEFDGGPCVCAPPGWDIAYGAPEIDQLSDYTGGGCTTNVTEESPTGGNFVAFNVLPGASEGISTTISGLTAGSEYYLAFWWMSVEYDCGGSIIICCSGLEITVDGESFVFDPVDQWELVELCIEAEGESMEIELFGTDDGMQGHIIIDNIICEEQESMCCSLVVELEEEYEICPEEELPIFAEYLNEVGDVTISWTSEPENGIEYLDDTSIINPTFNYVNTDPDFEGESFEFCLTVEDEVCSIKKNLIVSVHELSPVSFDFEGLEICELDEEYLLPTVSLEGISGTWNIAVVDLQEHAGTGLELYFTPDPGEVPCPESSEHELDILEYSVPSFDFPLEFCRGQYEEYEFPEYSLEGVEGYWNIEVLEFDEIPDGPIQIHFTPEDFCSEELFLDIEIYSGDELSFDFPSDYCKALQTIYFPAESLDGIEGSWTYDSLNISDLSGSFINSFTANSQDCYQIYDYEFNIVDSKNVDFDQLGPICKDSSEIILDSTSLEGYSGYWETQFFRPDTISGDTLITVWIPLEHDSLCISNDTLIIELIDVVEIEFDIDPSLCVMNTHFEFPIDPIPDTIQGNWAYPAIDPSSIVDSFTNTFTIDSQYCAQDYQITLFPVISVEPEFELDTIFCENENNYILPSTDINGIEGQWSQTEVVIADLEPNGSQFQFIPSEPGECIDTFYQNFYSSPIIQIEFELPDKLCWNDPVYEIPSISLNGIEGQWNIEMIDPDIFQGDTLELLFIATDGTCTDEYTWMINVSEEIDFNNILNNPSSCTIDDGSIALTGDIDNLQFSIDGGQNWQIDPLFTDLGSGNYTLLVRDTEFVELSECYQELELVLIDPESPQIISVEAQDQNSCGFDSGSIQVYTDIALVEYSIDGGVSWQESSLFENLASGEYEILVRSQVSPDCISSQLTVIENFPDTEIQDVLLTDLVSCVMQNGIIEILATGSNLEYSIDGGISWQDESIFTMLEAGDYIISCRSTDAHNCVDEQSVELKGPVQISLDSIQAFDPSYCDPNGGSIEVFSQHSTIEYSIDGGLSWQDQNIFSDLTEGPYMIQIRDVEHPDCLDAIEIILDLEDSELPAPYYSVVDADCWEDNGTILFDNSIAGLEFSFDGGMIWNGDYEYAMLAAGEYRVLIRSINEPLCQTELLINIAKLFCPCQALELEYILDPILCAGETGNVHINSILGFENSINSISWNNGTEGYDLINAGSDWYFIEINYDDDCVFKDSIYLTDVEELDFGLQIMEADCEEAQNGSVEFIDVSGGTEPYNYSLNGEQYQSESGFYGLSADEYIAFLLDDNGCIKSSSLEVLFNELDQISLASIIEIEAGEIISLNPLINESSIDSFLWTPSFGILNPGELIAQIQIEEDTEFSLEIFFGGCVEQRSIQIKIIEKDEIFLPNIISLDRASSNNGFYPQTKADSNIHIDEISILDRWGNLIYHREDPDVNEAEHGWNGYYNDTAVDPGVFVYVVHYSKNNTQHILYGSITVVR